MTNALTLEQLFKVACDNAARIFDQGPDHEVLPMWHAVAGNGENVLIATPWSSDEEKDAAVRSLRMLFARDQVKRFAFITEAWIRQARSMDDALDGRVSEHEDRREVVMISAEDRDGSMLMGWFYILRPEHGPPKLSPLEVKDFDGSTGRMMGLLT